MKRNEGIIVRTYLLFGCFGRCVVVEFEYDPGLVLRDEGVGL